MNGLDAPLFSSSEPAKLRRWLSSALGSTHFVPFNPPFVPFLKRARRALKPLRWNANASYLCFLHRFL